MHIKDLSREYRTYSRVDGSGEDHWVEDYAVVLSDGQEVFRTCSYLEAKRFVESLNDDRPAVYSAHADAA